MFHPLRTLSIPITPQALPRPSPPQTAAYPGVFLLITTLLSTSWEGHSSLGTVLHYLLLPPPGIYTGNNI